MAGKPIDVLVGGRLKELRETRNLSQSDVGRAADIPVDHLADCEQGVARLSSQDLIVLTKVFGIELRAFFPIDLGLV